MDENRLGEALWTMHLENMHALDSIVENSKTRGENGVLLYLYHVGRPLFPGDLTGNLGLTTGRIANILKMLEKSGYVVRRPDAVDKRRVLVALTPAGEKAAARRNEEAISYHTKLLSQLKPDEAKLFLDVLKRIVSAIDAESSGPNRA